jgi:hypothetical protein
MVGEKKKIEEAKGMSNIANVHIKSLDGTWTQQLNPDVMSSGMDVELYSMSWSNEQNPAASLARHFSIEPHESGVLCRCCLGGTCESYLPIC